VQVFPRQSYRPVLFLLPRSRRECQLPIELPRRVLFFQSPGFPPLLEPASLCCFLCPHSISVANSHFFFSPRLQLLSFLVVLLGSRSGVSQKFDEIVSSSCLLLLPSLTRKKSSWTEFLVPAFVSFLVLFLNDAILSFSPPLQARTLSSRENVVRSPLSFRSFSCLHPTPLRPSRIGPLLTPLMFILFPSFLFFFELLTCCLFMDCSD